MCAVYFEYSSEKKRNIEYEQDGATSIMKQTMFAPRKRRKDTTKLLIDRGYNEKRERQRDYSCSSTFVCS
jgi:hypothetical protein